MKTISIVIPTYNEADNVPPLYAALREQFEALKGRYAYEIIFIDNKSKDDTRGKILQLCARDACVKAIFNARNFGHVNSPYYGAMQARGDCTIIMGADFQDPPALVPRMIEAWEQGHKIVCMVKSNTRSGPLTNALRSMYYRTLRRLSSVEITEDFAGLGLYDKSVVEAVRTLDDPEPFWSGIVAELGCDMVKLPYVQAPRRAGKSSNGFSKRYDYAMAGVTAYTKTGLRLATLLGILVCAASFIAAAACLFIHREALLMLGLFFLGGVQLFFIGLLGEYVVSIHRRSMQRPLVFEERRVNFEGDSLEGRE